jgi:hypothetical protein
MSDKLTKRLEREGKIRRQKAGFIQIEALLREAVLDLEEARKIVSVAERATRALNGESNHDLAREAGVPKGYTVQCAVIVGYAAAENKFSVGERSKRGKVNYVE